MLARIWELARPRFINTCFTHNDMTETVSVIIMPKRKHSYRILFSAFRYYYAPFIFPNSLCPKISVEWKHKTVSLVEMDGRLNRLYTFYHLQPYFVRAIIGSNYNLSVRDCAYHLHQMPMQQTANRSKFRTTRTPQPSLSGRVFLTTMLPYRNS